MAKKKVSPTGIGSFLSMTKVRNGYEGMLAEILKELNGGRSFIIAAVLFREDEGVVAAYCDSDPIVLGVAFDSICSYAARKLGPERALDIATGATVGRATDNP